MYLVDQAIHFQNRIALECGGATLTYGELLEESERLTGSLLADRSDLRGERIVSLLPPSIDYVLLQWAVWRSGGVFVPLPTGLPDRELILSIDDMAPTTVVTEAGSFSQVAALMENSSVEVKTMKDFQSVASVTLPRIDEARPCMMLYTSGTTGQPKGVVITHANLMSQIMSLQEAWGWTEEDKTLLTLPLTHVHGIVNILCSALASGALCRIHSGFSAEHVWNEFDKGDLTLFMAVPTIYAKLVQYHERSSGKERERMTSAASRLRLTVSGSAPLSTPLFRRWHEISGHRMLERYGMTETGMILSNPLKRDRREGTVGQPFPGVSVRLVDESMRDVEAGVSGDVLVKGDGVFSEYWQRPEETTEAFHEGWFRTGDLAVVEDGYFRLLGRLSQDIIMTGGHKVSALEIEDVIRTHPSVQDAAVVSVSDEVWGEIVCAAIIPGSDKLSNDELLAWSSEQLDSHKRPRRLLMMNDFPRNRMGKVLKKELVRMFEESAASESDDDTQ